MPEKGKPAAKNPTPSFEGPAPPPAEPQLPHQTPSEAPPGIPLDTEAINKKLKALLGSDPQLNGYRRAILLNEQQLQSTEFTEEEKDRIEAELAHAHQYYQLRRRVLINHERKLERRIVQGRRPTILDHPYAYPIALSATSALAGAATYAVFMFYQSVSSPVFRQLCESILNKSP